MIRAEAADGTIHEFPDGIDGAVVDRVMKDYATKGAAPTATPAATSSTVTTDQPQMTRMQRFGTGMMDPVVGAGQLLAHVMPSGTAKVGFEAMNAERVSAGLPPMEGDPTAEDPAKTADKEVADRESKIAATTPKGGIDWYRMAGNVASPINYAVPGGVLGKANVLRRAGSAALQGAGVGALQPATTSGSYTGEKVMQAGIGGAAGGVTAPLADTLGAAGRVIWQWLTNSKGAAIEDKAAQAILKRMDQDIKGGGPTAQDMLDLLGTASGKPLTLADVGGANLQSLIGRIQREPGQAKQIITNFLQDRDLNAGLRLQGDISEGLGSGSAHDTAKAMIQARSIAAKPLFEKAYEGGSVAPLRRQFEVANGEAGRVEAEAQRAVADAQRRITQAAAKQSRAGEDVYATSGANADMRTAQAELQAAQQKLASATQQKQQIFEVMRQAQADDTANAPGAMWSPRVQEFLNNPRIQQGIRRGLRIERDTALAEGRAMNPTEYAIVGTDQSGEPIVGKVPTMRLLAVAKEGLDRMLQSPGMRNEMTGELNKEGVAVDQVRKGLLAELDRLNPSYKAAREQWSGDTQSMIALNAGQEVFKKTPEELRDIAHDMNPNDLEFFRLGAAATLRRLVASTGAQGNEARQIVDNAYARERLRPFFPSEAAYNKFINSVKAESLMFTTKFRTMGGSQTAGRAAEDTTPNYGAIAHGVRGGIEAATGNLPWAGYNLIASLKGLLPKGDPEVNAAIARITMDPSKAPEIIQEYPAFARALGAPGITLSQALTPGAVSGAIGASGLR